MEHVVANGGGRAPHHPRHLRGLQAFDLSKNEGRPLLRAAKTARGNAPMYKIAVLPCDGVGPEVVAEGLKVLQVACDKHEVQYETVEYDVGGDRYLRTGEVLPDSVMASTLAVILGVCILSGSVVWISISVPGFTRRPGFSKTSGLTAMFLE